MGIQGGRTEGKRGGDAGGTGGLVRLSLEISPRKGNLRVGGKKTFPGDGTGSRRGAFTRGKYLRGRGRVAG